MLFVDLVSIIAVSYTHLDVYKRQNGEIDTEFIPVESEHSAMSASIGSEAAGARTLTATSSAGLALMWEELLLAASNRMPIALALVNRTLSGPININLSLIHICI